MATYISRQLRGKRYAYASSMVGKSEKQRNADELFHYLINDPDPERKWNFGVFIVHREGMREQLRGREFEEHKNWVFNTHPDKVPSFKELLRRALIVFIRCCTRVLL